MEDFLEPFISLEFAMHQRNSFSIQVASHPDRRRVHAEGVTRKTRQSPPRRGAIIALAAIVMVVLLGFVAFVVDVGRLELARTQLQLAADASALAGAGELGYRGAGDTNLLSNVQAVTSQYASCHTAAGSAVNLLTSDTVLGKWDSKYATFTELSGSQLSSANAVKVSCICNADRSNPVTFFFAPIFGNKNANVSATAIARVKTSRCGLIIGINSVVMSGSSYTDSYTSDDGPYNYASATDRGHVCSNGNIVMSGSATIHGDAHPGPGKQVTRSGAASVTGAVVPLTKALSYPAVNPGNAATVNDNAKIPKTDNNKVAVDSQGNFTLSGNDGVTLPPGTYYFTSIALSGSTQLRIVGSTTIYVTGKVALSGGTMANQTSLPKNLSLNVMAGPATISGTADFYGAVYAPQAAVVRSGNAAYFGSIVGLTLDLSGSGGIHADESLDAENLNSSSSKSVIVQ